LFTIGWRRKSLIADIWRPLPMPFSMRRDAARIGPDRQLVGHFVLRLQIYFDFSAYSDMALGSSVMLGIRLPVNFHSPYKAASIIEFWRRWHISYRVPARLSLCEAGRQPARPRTAVSQSLHHHAAGGLWHGPPDLHAVGGLHGLYLTINHVFRRATKGMTAPPQLRVPLHVASVALTFSATTLTGSFSAAPTLSARNVIGGLFGGGHSAIVSFSPLAAVTLLLLSIIVWLMPNSMELMWRYRPALPSPYAISP